MRYRFVAKNVVDNAQRLGVESFSFRPFLDAMAWELIRPDEISVSGRHIMSPDGLTVDAAIDFEIPGIKIESLLFEGGFLGRFDPDRPPAWITQDWNVETDLAKSHGQNSVDFHQSIRRIFITRLYGTGLFNPKQEHILRGLIDAGFIPRMISGPDKSTQWNTVADEMQKLYSAYAMRLFRQAKTLALDLESNQRFWETVYNAVEIVAEAPDRAIKAVAGFSFDALGTLISRNPIFSAAIILGVGFMAWPHLSKIPALVKR